MADDGYLIGFEDSNGNFVEVGRVNNTASDVTQPLEIKHANSGERITLDSSGFTTDDISIKRVADNYVFAEAFAGATPDDRLSNALSASPAGSTIRLESETYTQDQSIGKGITLIGAGPEVSIISSGTKWGFTNSDTLVDSVRNQGQIVLSSIHNKLRGVTNAGNIDVSGTECILTGIRRGTVTFTSGSTDCVIDSSVLVSVIDNGSGNIVGDIA
jgi:hypothetical protein